MHQVTSKDGTSIAYERSGHGPAVVIVGGVLGDHTQQAPLAALLAERFTVYNFDRRGHGESGLTEPYAVEREFDDIEAIIGEAGSSAMVYGTSGPGVLALLAAASGLAGKMPKLAIWEPPFIVDASRPPAPKDYQEQLARLWQEGRRGDMVELFFVEAIGMPRELVAQMRQAPWWAAQEALARTTIFNATIMRDFSLPRAKLAAVTSPTLVIDGGTTPWLSYGAQATAEALPQAQRRTIAGQPHNVDPATLAPVLIAFFEG